MKTPTKSELYAQVEALTRENIALQEQLEAQERKQWDEKKDNAVAAFYKSVPFMAREMVNVTFEHTDKAGYWFTFELINDSTRQTYCVRHTDL